MQLKPFRLLLWAAAALGLVAAVLVAVGLTPAFQTWAVRRFVAAHPGVRLQVGEVSAGWSRIAVQNLHYEQRGAVLTVPAIEIAAPVLTLGFDRRIAATRFVARGWTLDLGKTDGAVGAGSPEVAAGREVTRAFAGLLARLDLPCDLAVDGVDWEGEVILPESRGRVKLRVRGGGLRAGGEGKFDLAVAAALRGSEVDAVTATGRLLIGMGTPRSFSRASVEVDALARGEGLSDGVVFHAEARARRTAAGENYAITVSRTGREMVGLAADFSRGGEKISGTWRLDVRDDDLARFARLGNLPAFSVTGSGAVQSDASWVDFIVSGKIEATGERLEVWRPELAPLGRLNLGAAFDLSVLGPTIAVRRFEATVAGEKPVAAVRALQAFEWRPADAEFAAAEPKQDVFSLVLHGVPIAWLGAVARPLELSGSSVRGELLASPRNGGVTLRSVAPVVIEDLSMARAGHPWLGHVGLTLNAAGDYTPHGWQVEISDAKLRHGDTLLLSGDGRAGQLAGHDQPVKTMGRLVALLPGWATQPVAAGLLELTGGELGIEFTASLGRVTGLEATFAGKNLRARCDGLALPLPALALTLRTDVEADGRIVFKAPIAIEHEGRKTDLLASGSLTSEPGGVAVEAQLAGANFVLADVARFGAALGKNLSGDATAARPPWAGWRGNVALRFDTVVAADSFRFARVGGNLRAEAGGVTLEGLQAELAAGGRARVEGSFGFRANSAQPYAAQIDVDLREIDLTALPRATTGGVPLIEGKLDAAGRFSAVGSLWGSLAEAAVGEVLVTSRGGVFRGFPVTVTTPPESTSRLASLIASAGSVFGGKGTKKEVGEIAGRADATAELARGWNPIAFDQLSFVLTRDAMGTRVKNFALIAPELRLTGSGSFRHQENGRWTDEPLTMDYRLRARGRQAELLKYLGVLETHTDDLGYAGCSMPLRVAGTLAAPDPMELDTKLAALALEKGGLVDRATELFNKLRGTGK